MNILESLCKVTYLSSKGDREMSGRKKKPNLTKITMVDEPSPM